MCDEFYMDLALKEAWKWQILTYPNPAVGCVVLGKHSEILSIKAHQKAGSFHAELNAIFSALNKYDKFRLKFETKFGDIKAQISPNLLYEFILENHGNFLKEATAFVTLEPCSHYGKTPPCANLLKELGFKRVVISVKDNNEIASGGAKILENSGVEVRFGVLESKGLELLEPFLSWQKGNFSFLKLGIGINGILKGGIITNLASRKKVHQIREVLDLLVVGGNTVRIDRPTLDTRLSNGKNLPDIFIYSNIKEFDKTIPLFNVKNREVIISNDIEQITQKPLVMFEGGENMINNLPNFVTHLLIFFSPNLKYEENFKTNLNLKLLNLENLDENFYGWFKINR